MLDYFFTYARLVYMIECSYSLQETFENTKDIIQTTNNTMAKRKKDKKKSLKIPKGGNQNPYIEDGQTKQWTKKKYKKDKQRSTKHTVKTKDRVT